MKPGLVILTGTTASGKTTTGQYLLKLLPLSRMVTCTTRAPREGEVEAEDYYFISRDQFEQEEREGKIVVPCTFSGNRYGTRREEIERIIARGGTALLILELSGAKTIREIYPDAKIIYLGASIPTIFERAKARNMPQAEIERRIKEEPPLTQEEAHALHFDYILNDAVSQEETIAEVARLLQ